MAREAVAAESGLTGVEEEPSCRSTSSEILKLAVPQACSNILALTNELTNTVLLGHAGNEAALAAVGLGNMMQNCFGLSVGFGIAASLDTLVSQAYGAGQHQLCCHYLQRCRILLSLQLLWMVPLLWSCDLWLLNLHQNPEVAQDAAEYNKASVLGLFFIFQFECNKKFLGNRGLATPAALISVVGSVLHVAWAYIFVVHLGLGNSGAGYANALTWFLQCAFSCVYLVSYAQKNGLQKRQVLWIQRSGFREWPAFMKIALPATIQLCSEWWFWEICALLVGYLGKDALAAHVSATNFIVLTFMPTIGLNMASATVVGNSLGANQPTKARQAVWLCVAFTSVVWLLLGTGIYFGRDLITEAYTESKVVRRIMKTLLSIYLVAGSFDSLQNVMGGALRGIGWQRFPAAVYIIAFYLVMLPLGCIFAFPMNMGVDGIWWSMAIGTALACTAFATVLKQIDWSTLAAEASAKMKQEGSEIATSSAISLERMIGA